MINIITEQTFESRYSTKPKEVKQSEKMKFLVNNYDFLNFDLKAKYANKNNIFKEIETIKEKDANSNVDYIEVLKISETEYEKSIIDCKKAISEINDEIINDIKSQKKLINVHKNVLEIFSYLIQEKYFDWNIFKEKINIFEVKCKMENITASSFPQYNKKKINSYLNKISKNSNLNHDYLIETFPGLAVIFNWIKGILKIYLYKIQNNLSFLSKDKNIEDLNRVNELFPPYNVVDLSKLDALKSQDKFKRNKVNALESSSIRIDDPMTLKTNNNENFTIKSEEYKKVLNNNQTNYLSIQNNLYMTSTSSRNHQLISQNRKALMTNSKNKTEMNLKSTKNVENPYISEKFIKIDVDLKGNQKKAMLAKLKNLPLIHVRTFHQLREHFKMNNESNTKSHIFDVDKFSLKNQSNLEKMINVLQKGNIGSLDRGTVLEFCKNIEKENKTLSSINFNKKR